MNVNGHHYSMPMMVLCGLAVLGGAIVLAFFGFGVAPWFILMGGFCILMMGSMLWMMVGMGGHAGHPAGSHGHDGGVVASGRSGVDGESAIEILERRFAEGAVTPEDYRARREILVGHEAQPGGRHEGSD